MHTKLFNVDRLLEDLGKYGRYQMCIYFLVNLTYLSTCWDMLIQTFHSGVPPFDCHFDNDTTDIPADWQPDRIYSSDGGCSIRHNSSSTGLNQLDSVIVCGLNNTHIVFDASFGQTIVSEWELICSVEKQSLASFAGSIYMIGILVGCVIVCPLADVFGRRIVCLICLWLHLPLAVGIAFVRDYYTFVILRFLCGTLIAGSIITNFVISCEIITKDLRSYVGMLCGVFWCGGFVSLGIIAYFVPNWRHLQLFISAPSIIYLSYYWLLPESIHWLATQNKTDQLAHQFRKACKMNRKSLQIENYYEDVVVLEEKATSSAVQMFASICKHPLLLLHLAVMSLLWFVDSLLYYGLSLFSTQLSGNRHVSFCLSGAIELPGYVFICFLMQWIGRQWSQAALHGITGLVLVVLSFTPTSGHAGLVLCLALIGKFAISTAFMGLVLYSTEISPTTVRNVGCGINSMAGKIGGIFAPYVGLVSAINPSLPPFIFGVLAVGAGVVSFLLPETRDMQLMETPADVRPSWVVRKCCFRNCKNTTDAERLNKNGKKTAGMNELHEVLKHDSNVI